LANLVANANRHGRPPVRVRLSGATVRVDDCGDGYPAWLLADGPTRFGSDGANSGHGLGLVIAEAQARALGSELVLRNRAATGNDVGGATAELRLVTADPDVTTSN
jgi:K+-sensing histidine kinase KdpD